MEIATVSIVPIMPMLPPPALPHFSLYCSNAILPMKGPRWGDFNSPMDQSTAARMNVIAAMRSNAVREALSRYPETTHILMVDSYYLDQKPAIDRLIHHYKNGPWDEDIILGATIWQVKRTRLRRPWSSVEYYDWGSSPEARKANPSWTGYMMPVKAVGGCYIFPVEAWHRNGYRPETQHFETEHVSLCKGYKCYLDFDAKLWRDPMIYPISKLVRIAIGDLKRRCQ